LQLTYTYDKAGNRLTKKYDNDGTRVENYSVNGYNQLTAVAGTAREYTNVCGLLDESNVDTVTVKNTTFDPDEEAARVDLMHDYFIGRKLKVADGDNGNTSCCLDEASLRRVSRSCDGDIEVTVTDLAGNSTTAGSGGTYDFDQEEDIDVKYEYDVRGNMVLKQVWDGEAYVDKERYFYNYDNLIEYIWYASGDNNNKHPHFIYDGLNRRVRIEYGTVTLSGDDFSSFSENTTKEYVFNGVVPIVEYDYDSGEETRTVARQYYWGLDIVAGIGGLLYQKVEGSPDAYYYYHYDGSGNVTAITDADKDVKALYEYDAFGSIISKAGTLANDFTFSTQMAYGASGWSMYMFRSYSSRLGRWTQRDPMGLAGGLNPYAFCGNDPLNRVDLLGLLLGWDVGGTAKKAWNRVKKTASDVGNAVVDLATDAADLAADVGTAVAGGAKRVVCKVRKKVREVRAAVVDVVTDVINDPVGFFADIGEVAMDGARRGLQIFAGALLISVSGTVGGTLLMLSGACFAATPGCPALVIPGVITLVGAVVIMTVGIGGGIHIIKDACK
jgi:RHS repeat-associated protein